MKDFIVFTIILILLTGSLKIYADKQVQKGDTGMCYEVMCTEYKPPTIDEMIKSLANKYELDPDTMLRIAIAESRLEVEAKNPNSTATGLFQILEGTWDYFNCTGDRETALDNAKCAMIIAKTSGLQHWNSSKNSWK